MAYLTKENKNTQLGGKMKDHQKFLRASDTRLRCHNIMFGRDPDGQTG
jgi:hypothetical protein